jgi:signal transduction histidine kinase
MSRTHVGRSPRPSATGGRDVRYLGWVLFATTCVLVALQIVLLGLGPDPLLSYEVLVASAFPWVPLGSLVGSAVGALIIWRYPRNIVGWLLCVGQLGSPIGTAAHEFATLATSGQIAGAQFADAAFYLSDMFDAYYTLVFLIVIFMIVPDGRLLSRRWRAALVLPFAAIALRWSVILSQAPNPFAPGSPPVDPAAVLLATVAGLALLLALALGAVCLWLRLRRSTGIEHQQLRWITSSAAGLALMFGLLGIVELAGFQPPWVVFIGLYLSYLFVLVAIGIAVLRYRLYDIDVILSRAIVLGVLAAFVTIGYIVVVVAIGTVLTVAGTFGAGLFWPPLVAIALVAAAFQPLRRHVLQLADRLVYGTRAAPYEALAELSRRLSDSPSPESLPDRVAAAAGRAVGAARVAVTLNAPGSGAPVRVARWTSPSDAAPTRGPQTGPAGRSGATCLRLPVSDMGEQIGNIEVVMPPGRALRTFERTLLRDVAAQAGVAFRNALLEAELAARVTEGEQRSADLAASRRRLVGVEDEARERLAAAISRSVVPHLAAVETGLTAVATADSRPLADRVSPLISETERALEELRTVVRGVFPALLERRGLAPALAARLAGTHPQAVLDIEDAAMDRLDRAVETAAYVFCIEVAPPDRACTVRLRVDHDELTASITAAGDWVDADPDTPSANWQHARDRVAALDGEFRTVPQPDGVTVTAVIPLDGQPAAGRAPAQTAANRSGPNAALGTYAAAPQSEVRSANSASS